VEALAPGNAKGGWTSFDFGSDLIVWVQIGAGVASSLLQLMSGSRDMAPQHEEASAFSEELGLKLFADLFRRLDPGVATVTPDSIGNAQLPDDVRAQWSGAVQLDLLIGSLHLKCVLSPAWVRRMVPSLPRRERTPRRLESLSIAVRNAKMPIRVCIKTTEGLPLGLFSELAEGSVVVLGCLPEAPWTIHGPGDSVLSTGYLGRASDSFAVQLTDRRIHRG